VSGDLTRRVGPLRATGIVPSIVAEEAFVKLPLSTGQVARLLRSTEPKLSNLVRCGLIQPSPEVLAGRRQWYAAHIFQAAKALGVLTPDLEARLAVNAEVGS
jgi:hypothetical protein